VYEYQSIARCRIVHCMRKFDKWQLRNFSKSGVWYKVSLHGYVPLFLELPEFSLSTIQDKPREASWIMETNIMRRLFSRIKQNLVGKPKVRSTVLIGSPVYYTVRAHCVVNCCNFGDYQN